MALVLSWLSLTLGSNSELTVDLLFADLRPQSSDPVPYWKDPGQHLSPSPAPHHPLQVPVSFFGLAGREHLERGIGISIGKGRKFGSTIN
jgi:hypothetical protein